MKVTKLIREYVEEQVSKVYDAKENPYTRYAKLDEMKLEDFQNELHKQQRELIDEFFQENDLYHAWSGELVKQMHTKCPDITGSFKTKAMIEKSKWDRENKRQQDVKVREIMVALELGANRQELNDMIAKLLEDAND